MSRAYAPPRLIAWETTRACPLACRHCRAEAEHRPFPNEFSTEECMRVLANLAGFDPKPIVILTGGEPMLRPDIYDIARAGTELGLRMVMAPCGIYVDRAAAKKMKESGIQRISLSVDGATRESHDGLRQVNGSFDGTMNAMEAARAEGLPFQINTTVSGLNVDELPALYELAARSGAVLWDLFFLVPTGRGKLMAGDELPPEEYEKTLIWAYEKSRESSIPVKTTCAPHYSRIVRQRGEPQPSGGHRGGGLGGCLGGTGFAFISHVGRVQMCGFYEREAGDLREADYDFRKVWRESEFFNLLRDRSNLTGRCGVCEYRKVCGGCRARAFAVNGSDLAEEPFCVYQPKLWREQGENGLDETDKALLNQLQEGFPAEPRPFEVLAARLGLTPSGVLDRTRRLMEDGFIRRIGPIFAADKIGYRSTLVGVRAVDGDRDALIERLKGHPGVSHLYSREGGGEWNLWFTLNAPDPEADLDTLGREFPTAEFLNLPALKTFKLKATFKL